MRLAQLRREYHQKICTQIIRIKRKGKKNYPNFADGNNRSSVAIAWGIIRQLKCDENFENLAGQETGSQFEYLTQEFITGAFELLQHLRPGKWSYEVGNLAISSFYQYEHLAHIEKKVNEDPILGAALRGQLHHPSRHSDKPMARFR